MDKVIVTALLIIGSVTAAVMVITTIGPSISEGSQSVIESNREAAIRLRTNIEVIAVAANTAGTQIDVWIKNVGVVPIYAIEKSDVFIVTPGTRFDYMTYAISGDNTWSHDLVGLNWNRGDTLHIAIELPAGNPLTAGDHVVKISTPNGVLAEKVFGT